MDRPLITFGIITYNHERFAHEALKGAFAQTYSPMEIVISDDCSTDNTFSILEKVVGDYSGPHQVLLSRNKTNLGIAGNINRVMELSRGEFIVIAAGDDISLPERAEKIWQAYRDSDHTAMSIFSSRMVVDEDGASLGIQKRQFDCEVCDLEYLLYHNCGGLFGCSHAWHRNVFQVFGGMLKDTISEDRVIPIRSAMLGKVIYVDEPLVHYRRHTNSLTSRKTYVLSDEELVSEDLAGRRKYLSLLRNYEHDLAVENELIIASREERNRLHSQITKEITLYQNDLEFIEGSFSERVKIILKGSMQGVGAIKVSKWLVRLFFPQLYIRMLRKKSIRRAQQDYVQDDSQEQLVR